ncbi:hypothetical protein NP233_g7281 [Leucocoprinus birnbaumii]|uniref:Uncharacterized protein n=1 Tax=Leucocoprinus birnbaumii TaxID=56174 RepID=A0AAD5YP82_9AGAR|nr:hypothetical protein NP233_g7281 [Leucocoprinus birnbaumii]
MLSRTPFYSLALFTAVLQTFFGFLASFINGKSSLLYIFGKIAGAASIATWLWIGILLRYNNKPLHTGPLTRSLAHFTSFVVLCLVWIGMSSSISQGTFVPSNKSLKFPILVNVTSLLCYCTGIGIMLTTQAVYECRAKTLWCAASSFSTTLAYLTGTFSGIAVLLIWLGSKKTGAGLSVNVAQINSRTLDYETY